MRLSDDSPHGFHDEGPGSIEDCDRGKYNMSYRLIERRTQWVLMIR